MKAHTKLLVGLCALLVSIGIVRGSNIKVSTNNIAELIGGSGLTNSAHLSVAPEKKKSSSLYDFGQRIEMTRVEDESDCSPVVQLINKCMPCNDSGIVVYKAKFRFLESAGGSLDTLNVARRPYGETEHITSLEYDFRIGNNWTIGARYMTVDDAAKMVCTGLFCIKCTPRTW